MAPVTTTPSTPVEKYPSGSAVGQSSTRAGSRVVIIGGGPGGYEAALVAAQLGADVTLVETKGVGGSAVLTDVVPSKTLIATAEWMTLTESAGDRGIRPRGESEASYEADFATVDARVLRLAKAQSRDIHARLEREGIRIIAGTGHLEEPGAVVVDTPEGQQVRLEADVTLLATGARPRVLPTAEPDGERILTWTQLYELTEVPRRLIVVGSGVTGAEFAGAYRALGAEVVLVSSRDRVLPGEDADAADVIEGVFKRRGMHVLARSRAESVRRRGDGVQVELTDGRIVHGSHCLMAVGGVPNTEDLGLAESGVAITERGHIHVDRVSRTTVRGIYAAGDCTGVLPLASVAAMQGRIAMWHALGDAVAPLDLGQVSANVFTAPEIATVGVSEKQITSGEVPGKTVTLPLARNPRAKMLGIREGFIKIFAHHGSGAVLGGVVVAPRASELIFPITLAISNRLTVDEISNAFTVYPSLSGSIAEAGRMLHEANG